MASELIVTCAVGFEDLFRGDLLQEHGIPSQVIRPGELMLHDVTDLGFLSTATAIDRVAVPWESDGNPERLVTALGCLQGVILDAPVRFRVQAAPDARGALIERYEQAGWLNAPANWQVNLDLEHGAAQLGPLAWAARFGTIRRLPAATPVSVVAGLLRLAKCAPHDVLLDPCAGVGTVLIVDAINRPDGRGLGVELEGAATEMAASNVADRDQQSRIDLVQGDATNLQIDDQSVDRIVTDLPFGKRIGSNTNNIELYPRVLREIERVLAPAGRCVLMTDDKRVFKDALARTRGLKIVREVVVRYNGVNPSAYVVARSRKPARPVR